MTILIFFQATVPSLRLVFETTEEEAIRTFQNYGGRLLPEQCVFSGICRETKKCFLYAVPCRNRKTLLASIKKNSLPGTTIIVGNCWKTYDCIEGLQGFHFKHL